MKEYLVKVERQMLNGKIYHTDTYRIMAPSPEEAHAVVHNSLEMSYEPKFRITEVVEHGKEVQTTDR